MSASTGGSAARYAGHLIRSLPLAQPSAFPSRSSLPANSGLHVGAADGLERNQDGELLDKMRQERFDVFITGDRNLQFQQHLPATGVAVVVLRAGSRRPAETLPLMKEVLEQIESLGQGTVTTTSNPS
jgi:hypothetical protein